MNRAFISSAPALMAAACAHAGPQHAARVESPARTSPTSDEAASAILIEQFIPAGRAVQAVHAGDLDGDGDADRLVVLESTGPDGAAQPRGVLLLVRDDAGAWRAAARNDAAIPCAGCAGCGGAMGGDPLVAVEAGAGGFALHLEGGSRELWSATFWFRYDAAASAWVLAAVERKVLDRLTGASRQAQANAAGFGRVTFADFDPADTALAPLD